MARVVLRVALRAAAALLALGAPTLAAAQTAVLRGTVRDSANGQPIPYAVVDIAQLALERFTDASGRLVLPNLPPGSYRLRVRRLGYRAVTRSVVLRADSVHTVDVSLARLPQQLAGLTIRGAFACRTPGIADSLSRPAEYGVIALLRENAERHRLLATVYPLRALYQRTTGEWSGESIVLERVDSTALKSGTRASYRSGRVVSRVPSVIGDEYLMGIPTILDVADTPFLESHCFSFGGTVSRTTDRGAETWLRLIVRAADRLSSPDIHGVFFLDSASSQLRRMELELSRPDRLPPRIRNIQSLISTTDYLPIADGLSIVERICAITRFRASGGRPVGDEIKPVELQRLARYQFENAPPDVPASAVFVTPLWRRGQRLPAEVLWCRAES